MSAPNPTLSASPPSWRETALAGFPAPAQVLLRRALAAGGRMPREDAKGLEAALGLTPDGVMLALRPVAAALADAPLSTTRVGTVCRGLSGALYFGCNVDFPGLSVLFTVHGETAAAHNAWLAGERGLALITRTRANCGACLQFLQEAAGADLLDVVDDRGRTPLSKLMPEPFSPDRFGRVRGFFVPQDHGLALPGSSSPLLQAALEAANASYAPYGKAPAGVALRMRDGALHVGRYAESMARNTSLPAVLAALSQAVLHGRRPADVVGAAFVEAPGAASQLSLTRCVLEGVGLPPDAFEHRTARRAGPERPTA